MADAVVGTDDDVAVPVLIAAGDDGGGEVLPLLSKLTRWPWDSKRHRNAVDIGKRYSLIQSLHRGQLGGGRDTCAYAGDIDLSSRWLSINGTIFFCKLSLTNSSDKIGASMNAMQCYTKYPSASVSHLFSCCE